MNKETAAKHTPVLVTWLEGVANLLEEDGFQTVAETHRCHNETVLELYEALDELLECEALDTGRQRPFEPNTSTNSINKAEAILAKARGESS